MTSTHKLDPMTDDSPTVDITHTPDGVTFTVEANDESTDLGMYEAVQLSHLIEGAHGVGTLAADDELITTVLGDAQLRLNRHVGEHEVLMGLLPMELRRLAQLIHETLALGMHRDGADVPNNLPSTNDE